MGRGRVFGPLKGGVVVVAVLALTLAGCGRRGALEAPSSVDPAVSAAGGSQPDVRPAPVKDTPFVLDSII